MDWYPLRFDPIYRERVWGGRALADLYGRDLPAGRPVGESWEICDRPDASSVVSSGRLAGRTLHELMRLDPRGLVGDDESLAGRFPMLVKILDANEVLSLQVHPPADRAAAFGGEPKTELWYFTAAKTDAQIYVGLRRGTSRLEFERRLQEGTVEACLGRLRVGAGDAIYLPSGRLHALGDGLVLFEIQENSDTTYRVFDWNRTGLDGRPRQLHVRESLESIDFNDCEPAAIPGEWEPAGSLSTRRLVDNGPFRSQAHRGLAGAVTPVILGCCAVIGVVKGVVDIDGGGVTCRLVAGDFCLLPAGLGRARVRLIEPSEWLVAEPAPGSGSHASDRGGPRRAIS